MRKVLAPILVLAMCLSISAPAVAVSEHTEMSAEEEAAMQAFEALRQKMDGITDEEATTPDSQPDRSAREMRAETQAIQLSQDIPQFQYMTFSQEPIGMSGEWLILPEHTVIYPAEGYKLAARGVLHGGPPTNSSTYIPCAEYGIGSEGAAMDYEIFVYPITEQFGDWGWGGLPVAQELAVEHVKVLPADTWNYSVPSSYVPASTVYALEAGTARTTRWNLVSDWALETVETATDLGLTPAPMKFDDDLRGDMERQQFAALVVRLWEKLNGTAAPANPEYPFEDIPPLAPDLLDVFDGLWDAWSEKEQNLWLYEYTTVGRKSYARACAQAYALNLVLGISDTVFAPQDTLTREQAATILYRLMAGENDPGAELSLTFDDSEEISGWAREAVAFLTSRGIINGVGNNRFAPKAPVTCEEALALAVRIAHDWETR